jgi:phasin family protein
MNNQWIDMNNQMSEEMYASFKKIADTNMKLMQDLVEMQTNVVKGCVEAAQANMEKLSGVKDYKDALNMQTEMARNCGEKMVNNYKEVVGVIQSASNDLSGLVEENMKAAKANIDKAAKTVQKAA